MNIQLKEYREMQKEKYKNNINNYFNNINNYFNNIKKYDAKSGKYVVESGNEIFYCSCCNKEFNTLKGYIHHIL